MRAPGQRPRATLGHRFCGMGAGPTSATLACSLQLQAVQLSLLVDTVDRDTDKTDRCPRTLGEYIYIESETMKKWTKPAYSDLRFGFEITMYIQHR